MYIVFPRCLICPVYVFLIKKLFLFFKAYTLKLLIIKQFIK